MSPSDVLNRESSVPLYAQLEEILRAKIAGGEWQPNQRIPSENELNKIYGLSRMTARGVLTKLVNEGVLFRVPGKGTFLSPGKFEAISPAYRGVREQLEAMGYQTTTYVLGMGLEDPAPKVRDKLKLADGAQVYAIHRLRAVQSNPISLHHSFVPAALAPGLDGYDTGNEQLCVILETNYGLAMKQVEEHLEATAASGTEAEHLGMRRGQPVLLLEDVIRDDDGVAFEYSTIVFRGDRVRLGFDYKL